MLDGYSLETTQTRVKTVLLNVAAWFERGVVWYLVGHC
jgi:hypothetical protein